MQTAIEVLITSPRIGISCKTKGIDRTCRVLIFENYLIFYQINKNNNVIRIIRVLHGSRKYQGLVK